MAATLTREVRERGLPLSGPLVLATIDGRKHKTRRVITLREFQRSDTRGYDWTFRGYAGCWQDYRTADLVQYCCPYGQPGDQLYFKETWQVGATENGPCIAYRAGSGRVYPDWLGKREFPYDAYPTRQWEMGRWIPDVERAGPWMSGRFMPRWAARVRAVITSVDVEFLQDITHEDAVAEGFHRIEPGSPGYPHGNAWGVLGFSQAWDALNGKRGYGWDTNPPVWVIGYRLLEVRRG